MAPVADGLTRGARPTLHRTLASSLLLTLALLATMTIPGCDDKAGANVMSATIGGKTFFVEVAADFDTRVKGLMHRTHIDDDGGMIFVFPPSEVKVQGFWMKNCLTDMDILYLDSSGRVLATHTMKVEPPQQPGESEDAYNRRLPTYSSKFSSPIAIEVQPGTVNKLGVKPGDLVKFNDGDLEALKKRAK